MNKMLEFAQLLGVELGKEFEVKDKNGKTYDCKYVLKDDGLYAVGSYYFATNVLRGLLAGTLKIKTPQILNKQEKDYLENVIRPFRGRVEYIFKHKRSYSCRKEYIAIMVKDDDSMCFPNFKIGSMYKNMKPDRLYTLEELGLFEDE